MTYRVCFPTLNIEKYFEGSLLKIPYPKIREHILEAVEKLAENPRPFGTKSFKQLNPPIQLYQYTAMYRIRVNDYRVLYDVDDVQKIVWVIALRKRSEKTYKF